MIMHLLAHAGEEHTTGVEATVHEWAWYVQLPVFFLVTVAIMTLLWLITHKLDTVIFISSFLMLIAGFAFFQVAPLISVVAITFGLIATLAVTLISLGSPSDSKSDSKK